MKRRLAEIETKTSEPKRTGRRRGFSKIADFTDSDSDIEFDLEMKEINESVEHPKQTKQLEKEFVDSEEEEEEENLFSKVKQNLSRKKVLRDDNEKNITKNEEQDVIKIDYEDSSEEEENEGENEPEELIESSDEDFLVKEDEEEKENSSSNNLVGSTTKKEKNIIQEEEKEYLDSESEEELLEENQQDTSSIPKEISFEQKVKLVQIEHDDKLEYINCEKNSSSSEDNEETPIDDKKSQHGGDNQMIQSTPSYHQIILDAKERAKTRSKDKTRARKPTLRLSQGSSPKLISDEIKKPYKRGRKTKISLYCSDDEDDLDFFRQGENEGKDVKKSEEKLEKGFTHKLVDIGIATEKSVMGGEYIPQAPMGKKASKSVAVIFKNIPKRKRNMSININEKTINKEGYLKKKGENRKAFQRRYFKLSGCYLEYFKDHSLKEKKGDILLRGMVVLNLSHRLSSKETRRKFVIKIIHPDRTWYLLASNKNEWNIWGIYLRRAAAKFFKKVHYVDCKSEKKSVFKTITDAIYHANNLDKIFVKKGIYEENLYIDKSIIIEGEKGVVIIGINNGSTIMCNLDGCLRISKIEMKQKSKDFSCFSVVKGAVSLYNCDINQKFPKKSKKKKAKKSDLIRVENGGHLGLFKCKIHHGKVGLAIDNDAFVYADKCLIYSNQTDGISVFGDSILLISSSSIVKNTLNGISLSSRSPCLIESCILYENKNGILLRNKKIDVNLKKNQILKNSNVGICFSKKKLKKKEIEAIEERNSVINNKYKQIFFAGA